MEVEPIEKGTIPFRVQGDIVRHLSIGLYRNFSRSIKELVSNAHDAGAKEIRIGLHFGDRRIVIRDDGEGMDKSDLEKLLNIGEITPITNELSDLGRKRIGTFGIGVLSVFPYSESIKIITKKKGQEMTYELTIDSKQFFDNVKFDLQNAKADYIAYKSDLNEDEGETIIALNNVAEHIIKDLEDKRGGFSSIEDYDGIKRFKWYLSQYCPIEFSDNNKELKVFFNDIDNNKIKVFVDGEELFRNVPEDIEIIEKEEKIFGGVRLKYVIMSPMKSIRPKESRGFQIRLRDVAIGLPRDFDVIKLSSKVLGKINWLCGEIHILEGLDEPLMIDRDNFFYVDEISVIEEYFRKRLIEWENTIQAEAVESKELYELVDGFTDPQVILDELKSSGIITVDKKQLRIPKKSMTRKKSDRLEPVLDKVITKLSKKRTNIEINDRKKDIKKPIEIMDDKIIIYSEHPDFKEIINYNRIQYMVEYSKWDINETPSICRLSKRKVEFNLTHPIFQSKLHYDLIKALSLGINVISAKEKNKITLIKKLEELLTKTFT